MFDLFSYLNLFVIHFITVCFFTFLPNDGDDDVAIALPCVHDDDASDGYDPYPEAFRKN